MLFTINDKHQTPDLGIKFFLANQASLGPQRYSRDPLSVTSSAREILPGAKKIQTNKFIVPPTLTLAHLIWPRPEPGDIYPAEGLIQHLTDSCHCIKIATGFLPELTRHQWSVSNDMTRFLQYKSRLITSFIINQIF